MIADWSQVIMQKEDNYTGYMYGAIDIRAVSATKIAEKNLLTTAKPEIIATAKDKSESVHHPYLDLIDESDDFSNFDFWYDNSTYLDLKGVAYIMAVRAIGKGVVGKIQYFKYLNPFEVQRIFNKDGELIGYREYKDGMSRDLPVEMIIPVIKLNPFDKKQTYSMADAAKDNQFTLKTANDYTRSAVRNNQNAPGIISTDAVLEGEELKNFKDRVMGRVKGEPIFGGGAGSIKWQDMQTDLNKAALKDVNSISLNNIIAVSGASKTMLGIEESGTTKDTSKTQKDNFIDYRAIPTVQKIVDALNQDFKKYYKTEYLSTKYKIVIDNPLGTDRDAEQKDVQIRKEKEELFNSLIAKGYDRELAARYVEGDISIADLGEPKVEEAPKVEEPTQEENHVHNQVDTGLLNQSQAGLQNAIVNIDERVIAEITANLNKFTNDLTEEQLLTKRQQQEYENDLNAALFAFYTVIIPLYAYNVLSKRAESYGKLTNFKINNEVRKFIKDMASAAAKSHFETTFTSVYKYAQEQALEGTPRDAIARNIVNKYGDEISKSRAVVIARTETNRAFTMSQYLADTQFLKENNLTGYKQWVTRSDNPCAYCQELASQPPIPFEQNFASIGDELIGYEEKDGQTLVKKMTVSYANLEAGNAHPNCGCTYELIIKEN